MPKLLLKSKHRMMCGDSTSKDDVALLMDGETVDLCFTSPPYNLGKSIGLRNGVFKGASNAYKSHDDNQTPDKFQRLLYESTLRSLSVSSVVAINIQMLSSNKKVVSQWIGDFSDNIVDCAIWTKTNPAPAMALRVMNSAFEFIWFLSPDKLPNRSIKSSVFTRGSMSNVYQSSVGNNSHTEGSHGATFPVEFAEHFIKNCSKESVLDTFCGSGTTLIACEKTNRKCYGMELDEHYCSVIIKRWEEYTGNTAIKEK